jgi:hypothetical protein
VKLNAIPIPKRGMLHGQVIEVSTDKGMGAMRSINGETQPDYNYLKVQPATTGNPRPQTQVEQTYLHELVHLIFYHAGLIELYKDEQTVDLIASLLHQFLATAEYK